MFCPCVAEAIVELDVVEANRKFMELSEELYDALMECHWQTAEFSAEQDYMTSSLPEPIYCWIWTYQPPQGLLFSLVCSNFDNYGLFFLFFKMYKGNKTVMDLVQVYKPIENVLWVHTILSYNRKHWIYLWMYKHTEG